MANSNNKTKFNGNKSTVISCRSCMIFLIIIGLSGFSIATDYAGYSGSFLRMGSSARSIAMGSSFTAELDRGFTAYHNPAGVVFLDRKQVTVLHHFLPLQRQYFATSFSTGLPPTAGIGLAWVSAGVNDIDGRNSAGFQTETLSTSENAVYVTFANQIAPGLSFGLNIKLLFSNLPVDDDNLIGKGTGFDLGVMYRNIPNATLAFSVQDFNSKYVWNTTSIFSQDGKVYNDFFPTIFRFGGSYQYQKLLFTGDYGYVTDMQEKYYLGSIYRLGAEYTWQEQYYFRAGVGAARVSLGVGMNYSLWKVKDAYLDYAFIYELPTGIAHVFTYAFNL